MHLLKLKCILDLTHLSSDSFQFRYILASTYFSLDVFYFFDTIQFSHNFPIASITPVQFNTFHDFQPNERAKKRELKRGQITLENNHFFLAYIILSFGWVSAGLEKYHDLLSFFIQCRVFFIGIAFLMEKLQDQHIEEKEDLSHYSVRGSPETWK